MDARALPMFPLGSVLFPYATLPLHVFEPRYRALTRDCLQSDAPEFGVVLIERGSEVGGGDVRFRTGTVARIVEAAEVPDGRWVLVTVGTRRIRVHEWLAEEPYPRAEVSDVAEGPAGPDAQTARDEVERLLRHVLALAAEAGDDAAPATVELHADLSVATWQAAALAPVGPADGQRILETESVEDRLQLLHDLLEDEAAVLAHRLSGE